MPTQLIPKNLLSVASKALIKDFKERGGSKLLLLPINFPQFELEEFKLFDVLKYFKSIIPSIKNIKYYKSPLRETMDWAEIIVDETNFKEDLEKLNKGIIERDRLIYKDSNETFWFNSTKEMVPKNNKADYWKLFTSLFKVAMNGEKDENHYFLAPYDDLLKELRRKKYILRSHKEKEIQDKIRTDINSQFKIRPKSFGLPSHSINGKEIIKITKRIGIKLYNPPL